MPPTEKPLDDDAPVELPPTDVTYEARIQWPYLTGWDSGMGVPQNGRELGCFIAGHHFGRHIHGEPGLRCEVPGPMVAGVSAVLLEYGLIVQRHSYGDGGTITLDVWTY